MRISDWSSDVCSSDLRLGRRHRSKLFLLTRAAPPRVRPPPFGSDWRPGRCHNQVLLPTLSRSVYVRQHLRYSILRHNFGESHGPAIGCVVDGCPPRSEEHTSEIQSLMRNSYAVFCLKKHNNCYNIQSHT